MDTPKKKPNAVELGLLTALVGTFIITAFMTVEDWAPGVMEFFTK